MKVSLWNQIVAPPSTVDQAEADPQHQCRPSCRAAAGTATCASVASDHHHGGQQHRRLARRRPRRPRPGSRGGRRRTAAAQSLRPSANLKVPKNRMIGRKSNRSFIWRAKSIAAELMQKRSPVGSGPSSNTWPRCEPQLLQRTSTRTMPWLLVDHALDDLAVDRLPVARPAAAGVELGVRLEQRRAAADAVVAARRPSGPSTCR